MPTKGGKKSQRGGKGDAPKRELVLKEEGQDYGQVTKNLGNSRMEVRTTDGKVSIGVIRGAIRRKMWIGVGDIVLVGIRDFEDGKVDIISKYSPEEAKALIKQKEIPPTMAANAGNHDDDGGHTHNVDFVTYSDDEEDPRAVGKQSDFDFDALVAGQQGDDEEEGDVNIDDI